jgi:hypothetical protein
MSFYMNGLNKFPKGKSIFSLSLIR